MLINDQNLAAGRRVLGRPITMASSNNLFQAIHVIVTESTNSGTRSSPIDNTIQLVEMSKSPRPHQSWNR
jgi:hypothetical protein